jgi:transcriptional regulator with XRE-family HTH domain
VPRPSKPPFPRRQVGRSLRRLRERAGLTQEEAGRPIRISKSKLSRIEQGHLPGYNDFLALLDRYGVLASDHDEYVRALDGDQIAGLVEVRMRRQLRLVGDPDFRVHVVVDELAFRVPWCDRPQLEKIIELAALPHLVIQVLPATAGPHGGLDGGFTILDFPDPEEPGLVYVAGGFGSIHLEGPKEIAEARLQFKHLSKIALDENASVELLKRLAVTPGGPATAAR